MSKGLLRSGFCFALGLIPLYGCTKKVTRLSADSVVDISGRWNDTDSREVAKTMIESILSAAWLEDFQSSMGNPKEPQNFSTTRSRRPVIVVGEIKNKSSEHIESDTFIKDIERELINGGAVRIITNSLLREKMRNERRSQVGYTPEEDRKKFGKELGADYIVFGTINTIVDANEDDSLIFYQVSLELVDLETGEVVWMGDKKLKKYRSKSKKVRKYQQGSVPSN